MRRNCTGMWWTINILWHSPNQKSMLLWSYALFCACALIKKIIWYPYISICCLNFCKLLYDLFIYFILAGICWWSSLVLVAVICAPVRSSLSDNSSVSYLTEGSIRTSAHCVGVLFSEIGETHTHTFVSFLDCLREREHFCCIVFLLYVVHMKLIGRRKAMFTISILGFSMTFVYI